MTSTADSSNQKIVLADFYWWYPWYGMGYKNPPGTGSFIPPVNTNGFARQDAFKYPFPNQIPYLKSSERPYGADDPNNLIAVNWFKSNFERAANAGIDVLTPMTRPDLPVWKTQLANMVAAQRILRNEGKKYPRLALHLDGVEYWKTPPAGDLTKNGQDFDTIWRGVKDSFDTIFSLVAPAEIPTYFLTYPNTTTVPIFVYRIEGNAPAFQTSDWWVTQLRTNFTLIYPGKNLYVALDDGWCNHDYGINNRIHTRTCNGDNYYLWGGAALGASKSNYAKPPLIYTVGPGFDRTLLDSIPIVDRQNGQFYQINLAKSQSDGVQWLLLETFNFGEESTQIDDTVAFGNQYLSITKNFINTWKGIQPTQFIYGNSTGDVDLMCDWDGDGIKTPGIFRNGTWFLKNSNTGGYADTTFIFGMQGDKPVCGDWTGQGKDTVGFVRGNKWYLKNSNTAGIADMTFIYGNINDTPIVGKWINGQKKSTPGVIRSGNNFFLSSKIPPDPNASISFVYGSPDDKIIVGDWNGDGVTTPAIFRSGTWYIRNSNSSGFGETTFNFGLQGDLPLVARYSQMNIDSVAIIRSGNLWIYR